MGQGTGAQQLRALTALSEHPGLVSNADGLQLSIVPLLENPWPYRTLGIPVVHTYIQAKQSYGYSKSK